jgi:GGDEF domain-containing protein
VQLITQGTIRFPQEGYSGVSTLNEPIPRSDTCSMTIASDDFPPAASTAATAPAVADMPVLLPSREALLERLADGLTGSVAEPVTLLVVGLLRRDDGWPTPRTTLSQVTALLAGSVRGGDWLGAFGAAEFGIVLAGPTSTAEVVAPRLLAAVDALGIAGLSASAAISPMDRGLTAGEVFRRATLSLTAARRVGAGTVIRYREPA